MSHLSSDQKLYAERDIFAQGEHYAKHVDAMTAEGLHAKSDIAAELAHRDIEIESLHAEMGRVLADRDIARQQLESAIHLLRVSRAAMTCKASNAPNAKHGFVEIRKDIDDFIEAETP